MKQSVDELRSQLRSLGYLTHGLERWFALDPWSSRTFWQELLAVAAKSALLVAPFAVAPMMAVMLIRNSPAGVAPPLALGGGWLLIALLSILFLVVIAAFVMKLRPAAPIDRPGILTATSLFLSLLLAGWIVFWWSGFEAAGGLVETAVLGGLLLALVAAAATVFAAALLSFSIHETRRIPAIARRPRSRLILGIGALMLAALVAVPLLTAPPAAPPAPESVLVTPSEGSLALVAVDGMTFELFRAHEGLATAFDQVAPLRVPRVSSVPELWATIGTGTSRESHSVRSIEGLRIGGGILQEVSRWEPLRLVPPIARTEPLPSNVRTRDYVWEILAARGIPVAAANWWLTPASDSGALRSDAQAEIFAAAATGDPARRAIEVDRIAERALVEAVAGRPSRFATVYLPAVDIAMNRLELPAERRPALVLEAVGSIATLVRELEAAGFEVVLVGVPGAGSAGEGVIASTLPLEAAGATAADVAPTLLDYFGFPASTEMAGRSLIPGSQQRRIASFGTRGGERPKRETFDREYHEALRSLGYVQ